jgi:membrane protease YdiL (CAAX protease family)
LPQLVFAGVCIFCEAVLLLFDRNSAYIGLGAFAYGLILWLIARACIQLDLQSEERVLKTTVKGWRLLCRVLVVAGILLFIVFGRQWFWSSPMNAAIQRVSKALYLGYGDSALPNAIFQVIVPGILLALLGAKPVELGLCAWRKGSTYALLGALVLPCIIAILWFAKGHGTADLLLAFLVHNFLSNGFSEEFLMRGMVLSHLRAFMSKDWAVVVQAILFGLFHVDLFGKADSLGLEVARDIAMNAPTGFFLALIALRARSVVLPGLIHTTLDTMNNLLH